MEGENLNQPFLFSQDDNKYQLNDS
jgi:hypothetical protein